MNINERNGSNSINLSVKPEKRLIRQLSIGLKNLSEKLQNELNASDSEDKMYNKLSYSDIVKLKNNNPVNSLDHVNILKHTNSQCESHTAKGLKQGLELDGNDDLLLVRNENVILLIHNISPDVFGIRTPWKYINKENTLRNNVFDLLSFFKLLQKYKTIHSTHSLADRSEVPYHTDLNSLSNTVKDSVKDGNVENGLKLGNSNFTFSSSNLSFSGSKLTVSRSNTGTTYAQRVKQHNSTNTQKTLKVDKVFRVEEFIVRFYDSIYNNVSTLFSPVVNKDEVRKLLETEDPRNLIFVSNRYYNIRALGADVRTLNYQKFVVFDLCNFNHTGVYNNFEFSHEFCDQVVSLPMNDKYLPTLSYTLKAVSSLLFWKRFDTGDNVVILNYENINFNIMLIFACVMLTLGVELKKVEEKLLNTLTWRNTLYTLTASNCSNPYSRTGNSIPLMYPLVKWPVCYKRYLHYFHDLVSKTRSQTSSIDEDDFLNYVVDQTDDSEELVGRVEKVVNNIILINTLIPQYNIDFEIYKLDAFNLYNHHTLNEQEHFGDVEGVGVVESDNRNCKYYNSIFFKNCKCKCSNEGKSNITLLSCPHNYDMDIISVGNGDDAVGVERDVIVYKYNDEIKLSGDVVIVFVINKNKLYRKCIGSYSFNVNMTEGNTIELSKHDIDIWDNNNNILLLNNVKIVINLSNHKNPLLNTVDCVNSVRDLIYGNVLNFINNHVKSVDEKDVNNLIRLSGHNKETCILALKICYDFANSLNLLIKLRKPHHQNYYNSNSANQYYRSKTEFENVDQAFETLSLSTPRDTSVDNFVSTELFSNINNENLVKLLSHNKMSFNLPFTNAQLSLQPSTTSSTTVLQPNSTTITLQPSTTSSTLQTGSTTTTLQSIDTTLQPLLTQQSSRESITTSQSIDSATQPSKPAPPVSALQQSDTSQAVLTLQPKVPSVSGDVKSKDVSKELILTTKLSSPVASPVGGEVKSVEAILPPPPAPKSVEEPVVAKAKAPVPPKKAVMKKGAKMPPPIPKGPIKAVKRVLPLGVKLHWKPLSKLNDTIFSSIHESDEGLYNEELIDVGTVKKLFSRSNTDNTIASKVSSKKQDESKDVKSEIRILSSKRVQNILIILRFNEYQEYTNLIDSVNDLSILNPVFAKFGDSDLLNTASVTDSYGMDYIVDNVNKLDIVYPNSSEVELLMSSYKANSNLEEYRIIEKMLIELLLRKRMLGKIKLCKYYIELFQQMSLIREQLDIFKLAIQEIKSSKILPLILNIILQYGNFVNYGNIKQGEMGFTLSSTIKLIDFKTHDNVLSSLHYLIINLYIKLYKSRANGESEVEDDLSNDLLFINNKLTNVLKAEKINTNDVNTLLKDLSEQLISINSLLSSDDGEVELSEKIDKIIYKCKDKLNNVNEFKMQIYEEIKQTWVYLGEEMDTSNEGLEKIFKILTELIKCIIKVFNDIKSKPNKYLIVLNNEEDKNLFLKLFISNKFKI